MARSGTRAQRFSLSMASSRSAMLPSLLTPNRASRRRSAAAIQRPRTASAQRRPACPNPSLPDEPDERSQVTQRSEQGRHSTRSSQISRQYG